MPFSVWKVLFSCLSSLVFLSVRLKKPTVVTHGVLERTVGEVPDVSLSPGSLRQLSSPDDALYPLRASFFCYFCCGSHATKKS